MRWMTSLASNGNGFRSKLYKPYFQRESQEELAYSVTNVPVVGAEVVAAFRGALSLRRRLEERKKDLKWRKVL